MPERQDDGHVWVGAATFPIPPAVVRSAFKRGFYRLRRDHKVDIMQVYCDECRLDYSRAAGKPCAALRSREHLIGGPVGDQRKRRGGEGDTGGDAHAVAV